MTSRRRWERSFVIQPSATGSLKENQTVNQLAIATHIGIETTFVSSSSGRRFAGRIDVI